MSQLDNWGRFVNICTGKQSLMYISKLSLVNYRNFRNAVFYFNKGINTIIGENGSGKSNLFKAIRLLLDDEQLRYSYKLEENDFNRSLGNWQGHWIIISLEFSDLSSDESIQSLFVHSAGLADEDVVDKATYNLLFRPKSDIRHKLSQLEEGDTDALDELLSKITISDYEAYFTGKSEADFNDPEVYKGLAGDFENVKFNYELPLAQIGVKIPHQLSISKDISFSFVKALRDVVSDFSNYRTNPLLTLLKHKSEEINPADYQQISNTVSDLNTSIEQLQDVQEIRNHIKETIKEAIGETYSPSSLSIKSSLPDDADKLFQSLKLFIGEPEETYEGGIHELSLGGANLIFLTLKLLEFKYKRSAETFANFLLIEEPEAHIHTHIQKTLFDKLNFENTQIIYSTHSTFISEASNVANVNILSKKQNYAEAYQPSKGLSDTKINRLQRYLDAVRSNLLFAKGVILVEGDAEQILVPLMVKRVLGVSLDELGISLINIGSTGFENIAQIFHDDRVRRHCSIVTDLDSAICDTTIIATDTNKIKKYKKEVAASAQSGSNRKIILDAFTTGNTWVEVFYATHTFEVDFLIAGNAEQVKNTVKSVYRTDAKKTAVKTELDSTDVSISGKRILTMAGNKGKGWFAILLGAYINENIVIPEYILKAIAFAKPNINRETILNIVSHRIKKAAAANTDFELFDLEIKIIQYRNGTADLAELIAAIEEDMSDDQLATILKSIVNVSVD